MTTVVQILLLISCWSSLSSIITTAHGSIILNNLQTPTHDEPRMIRIKTDRDLSSISSSMSSSSSREQLLRTNKYTSKSSITCSKCTVSTKKCVQTTQRSQLKVTEI